MCSLFFVGLGLDPPATLPLGTLEILKTCAKVYLESYTSPISDRSIAHLRSLLQIPVHRVGRQFLEDGEELLKEASTRIVAILSPGDPSVATTHMELRVRAEKRGIKTKVVHNSSILSSLAGEIGLFSYTFGKSVTLTKGGRVPCLSVYNTLYQNLLQRLHSIILLEYDESEGYFLSPTEAFNILLSSEEDYRLNVATSETFGIVASRVGSEQQSIRAGRFREIRAIDFGEPPHVIVIPGRMHFMEEESVRTLLRIDDPALPDNSGEVQRLAKSMVSKYTAKCRKALEGSRQKATEKGLSHLSNLFENVECYVSDAEKFLGEGRDELAILSIGYGEGLLDSLKMTGVLDVEW